VVLAVARSRAGALASVGRRSGFGSSSLGLRVTRLSLSGSRVVRGVAACGSGASAVTSALTIRSSRRRFAARLNSGVRAAMTDFRRSILAVAIGVSISALLHWYFYRQPVGVHVLPMPVISFIKVVQPFFTAMLLHLLPWFITGIIALRRPILCGAAGSALALAITRIEFFSLFSPDYFWQLVATSAGLIIVAAFYGAAGAALGVVARSSNNSFKPKPLRGSA